MSDELHILLTNDDGIESAGIRALYETLSSHANVTVVAPAGDQSAVGRAISTEVSVTEHEMGYAVAGTPSDCVVAGLAELAPEPDLVVAGCNRGANLGEYVLGRSGTISAAVEAAFFDIPALATSLYVPETEVPFDQVEPEPEDYLEATRVTDFLVKNALGAGVFEEVDYLNINVPLPAEQPAPVELTCPSKRYEMGAKNNGDSITLVDRIWKTMNPETIPDPPGTDRRAVVEGRISISPLSAPNSIAHPVALESLVESYLADA